MITAKEALELYDASGAEVNLFLKHSVESEVIKAAKGEKRTVFIHLDALAPFDHLDQRTTPLQRAIVAKLISLGYRAKIRLDGAPYVPRGLADDDGDGPSHTNFGIEIGW